MTMVNRLPDADACLRKEFEVSLYEVLHRGGRVCGTGVKVRVVGCQHQFPTRPVALGLAPGTMVRAVLGLDYRVPGTDRYHGYRG